MAHRRPAAAAAAAAAAPNTDWRVGATARAFTAAREAAAASYQSAAATVAVYAVDAYGRTRMKGKAPLPPNKDRAANVQRELLLALTGIAPSGLRWSDVGDGDFISWVIDVDTDRYGRTPLIAILRAGDPLIRLLPVVTSGSGGSGPDDGTYFPAEAARLQRTSPLTIDRAFKVLAWGLPTSSPVSGWMRTLKWLLAVTPVETLDPRGPRAASLYTLMKLPESSAVFEDWIKSNLSPLARLCCAATVEGAIQRSNADGILDFYVEENCFHRLVLLRLSRCLELSRVGFRVADSPAEFHPVIALAICGIRPIVDSDSEWCYSDAAVPLPPKYAMCFNALFASTLGPDNPWLSLKSSAKTALAVNPVTRSDFIEYSCATGRIAFARHLYCGLHLSRTRLDGILPWKPIPNPGPKPTKGDHVRRVLTDSSDEWSNLQSQGQLALLLITRAVRVALCDTGLLYADVVRIALEYLVLPLDVPYADAWVKDARDLALDVLNTANEMTRALTRAAAAASAAAPSAVVLKPIRSDTPRAKRMREA